MVEIYLAYVYSYTYLFAIGIVLKQTTATRDFTPVGCFLNNIFVELKDDFQPSKIFYLNIRWNL